MRRAGAERRVGEVGGQDVLEELLDACLLSDQVLSRGSAVDVMVF
jgi:hypothetical protein